MPGPDWHSSWQNSVLHRLASTRLPKGHSESLLKQMRFQILKPLVSKEASEDTWIQNGAFCAAPRGLRGESGSQQELMCTRVSLPSNKVSLIFPWATLCSLCG